jgi:ABC-type nitrate/sulfonate/bicarbonate transport system permease component
VSDALVGQPAASGGDDLVERRGPSAVAASRARYIAMQLAALVAFASVWQLLHLITPQNIVPGPADALPRLAELITTGQFIAPLNATLTRTILGFGGGFVLGVAYGISAGRSPGFRHVTSLVFLVLLFFNALVLIFWGLALFGTTSNNAAAVICTIAVAPTVGVYMRDVALSMDDEMLEMASAYHASRWQRFVDVFLPFLMPAALGSARIGFSLAWKITLLSEVFGLPNGIGWQIEQAYLGYQIAQLMAWLGVFIITLLLVEQSIRLIERRVVRWT